MIPVSRSDGVFGTAKNQQLTITPYGAAVKVGRTLSLSILGRDFRKESTAKDDGFGDRRCFFRISKAVSALQRKQSSDTAARNTSSPVPLGTNATRRGSIPPELS